MSSHCLNHPGILATKRCVSCLKPLCDSCTQLYAEGVFCGEPCHESAVAAAEKGAVIAAEEKALRERQQRALAYKMIAWVSVIAILFFGWDYFPEAVTDKIELYWGKFKSNF
jgi:recombinational DNA repair protein (RecF pathway)